MSSITQREICDLHFKLFAQLQDKQRTSLAEYVSFSYIASLNLYLKAYAQEDYENCVNNEVVGSASNSWLTSFLSEHTAFTNWPSSDKLKLAGDIAQVIAIQCPDAETCLKTGSCPDSCNACATAISRTYKNYEVYLNELFAKLFREHSENMFNELHEANLALDTAQA